MKRNKFKFFISVLLLNILFLQNISFAYSYYVMPSEVGASLGFGAGGNGKKSGSFGVNSGSSNRDSAWVNDMTEITGVNVDIAVAGKTSITGAMIDGDNNLHLTTNELEFKDLHDFERVGETGFGVSTSVGVSTDKEETSLHPNGETSLTLKDTGHDREQITRATIGAGEIIVGGVSNPELSGLNRDTTKAQEITKDLTTGTLDATASIDNRVFTSEGRADIAREHKKAGSFIENVSSNLYNSMAKDTKFADAMKSIKFEETSKLAVERLLSQDGGKEALEIISGQKQVSPEEKDLALSKFAGEFADITGVDIGDVKTMLSTEPIGGSFDKDGKDIYLNDNYVSGDVESGLGVFGHEIGHSMYGDDEATAGYLGSRFADAYTDGLWINSEDYSLGNWNIADENSLYVGQNGSDFANVKNRDDFEPISLTLTGLTVAGSLYSIQDSARKIYSWIEGEGYKGNTTYVDPISGEVYTSDAMLKEGAVDLATAAAISGAFKIGGKVVGKTEKSVKDTVNSIDDILKKNGKIIGNVNPGATSNIRTVTKEEFKQIKSKIIKGGEKISSNPNYNGEYYRLQDGSIVGIRNSSKNGETLDIIGTKFKIHKKDK